LPLPAAAAAAADALLVEAMDIELPPVNEASASDMGCWGDVVGIDAICGCLTRATLGTVNGHLVSADATESPSPAVVSKRDDGTAET